MLAGSTPTSCHGLSVIHCTWTCHTLNTVAIGPTLPFYTPFSGTSSSRDNPTAVHLTLTGLDPNSSMFEDAKRAAFVAGLHPDNLRLVEGDAQQMPFDSAGFDAAVMTLVSHLHNCRRV